MIRWDLRYYYWRKIKDFFTLKWNKPKWHLVSVTFDRYDPKSLSLFDSSSSLKLYWDGKVIQQESIKYPENYTFSVWINPETKLPFLGIDPK